MLAAADDLDQNEFAFDEIHLGQVDHLDHLDHLLELLDDLAEHPVVAPHDHGHARNAWILGRADAQAVDVVAPGAEQSRNPGQYPELILNQNAYGVSHNASAG